MAGGATRAAAVATFAAVATAGRGAAAVATIATVATAGRGAAAIANIAARSEEIDVREDGDDVGADQAECADGEFARAKRERTTDDRGADACEQSDFWPEHIERCDARTCRDEETADTSGEQRAAREAAETLAKQEARDDARAGDCVRKRKLDRRRRTLEPALVNGELREDSDCRDDDECADPGGDLSAEESLETCRAESVCATSVCGGRAIARWGIRADEQRQSR
jgi:hypothetical protein